MKRDKLQIIQAYSLYAKTELKKIEIVYKSNLNFKNAEIYLRYSGNPVLTIGSCTPL